MKRNEVKLGRILIFFFLLIIIVTSRVIFRAFFIVSNHKGINTNLLEFQGADNTVSFTGHATLLMDFFPKDKYLRKMELSLVDENAGDVNIWYGIKDKDTLDYIYIKKGTDTEMIAGDKLILDFTLDRGYLKLKPGSDYIVEIIFEPKQNNKYEFYALSEENAQRQGLMGSCYINNDLQNGMLCMNVEYFDLDDYFFIIYYALVPLFCLLGWNLFVILNRRIASDLQEWGI